MGKNYKKGVNTGNFLLKYGVTDRTGLKKRLYKIKDLLTKNSNRKYEYLSFYVKEFILEYLNENHETWNNPVDKNLKSTKSFLELYEESKKEARENIKRIDSYLKTKKDLQKVLKEIKNNSYVTGLPCDKPHTLKYFKY